MEAIRYMIARFSWNNVDKRKKWELFQRREHDGEDTICRVFSETRWNDIHDNIPVERNPDLCPLRFILVSLLRFISTGNDIISRDKDL